MSLLPVGLVSLLHCWFWELLDHTYFLCNSYVIAFVSSDCFRCWQTLPNCFEPNSRRTAAWALPLGVCRGAWSHAPRDVSRSLWAGTSEHTEALAVQMWRDLCGALEFIEPLQQLDKERENGRINLPVSHSDKRSSEMLIELGHWWKCSCFLVCWILLALGQLVLQHFCSASSRSK